MINVGTHRLNNGLRLVHHYDATTRMVALNLLYNVGSRNELPERTGLAHLMEHLMFTGSKNAANFDGELQAAGGESNAWTSNDLTNYYAVLPAHNIETALWLESDRLTNLNLSSESIALQKHVVVEEFKQRYLNQPYGDTLHLLSALTYKVHPYRWPTIGLIPEHIENTTEEEIRCFHNGHYSVDNLVMCISGHIDFDKAVSLAEKWFGDIKPRKAAQARIEPEPAQIEERRLVHHNRVPNNYIFKTYHTCGRSDSDYQATDLLSDIMANGTSSRLYKNVLLKSGLFSDIDAQVTASHDPGMLIVRAKLVDGADFDVADKLIQDELEKIMQGDVTNDEVVKYTNKYHSSFLLENVGYAEKALTLCRYEMLGDARGINSEIERYRALTPQKIVDVAQKVLRNYNCSTLYYSKETD